MALKWEILLVLPYLIIFSEHLEKNIFENLDNNNRMLPKVYLRYVDEVYAVFADSNSCSRFLSILNFQHLILKFSIYNSHIDIKFTMEKANKTLNLL